MPEAALQSLEEELSSEMFNEYTAALLDEIPPPQLPSGTNCVNVGTCKFLPTAREGNVFRSVCHSVHRGFLLPGGEWVPPCTNI